MNQNNDIVIPVFFTVDDGYVPFLSVALASMIENASPQRRYEAVIIHQDISEKSIERLAALGTDRFPVRFVPMTKSLESITDRMSNRLRCDYFTMTIYYRLFIAAMFPEYDKGIYIDSDNVIPGDISELYDIDLDGKLLGAAVDHSIQKVPELIHYTDQAVGVDVREYINSGVLLMDLKQMREVGMDERFLDLLDRYHFDCIAPDQDYINAMCYGRIRHLPPEWDAMPVNYEGPMENPKLIHYNLFDKPWCYDNIMYEDYFWKYAEKSGFSDEIRKFKEAFSDEAKQSDSDCFALMAQRAMSIPEAEPTFRTVFGSGQEERL